MCLSKESKIFFHQLKSFTKAARKSRKDANNAKPSWPFKSDQCNFYAVGFSTAFCNILFVTPPMNCIRRTLPDTPLCLDTL
jgi:hypothetical protein